MTCHLKHCTLWVFVILCIVKGRTCACSRARVCVCICHCHDRVLSANSNSNWDIIYTLFELVVSFANFRMKHSFSFSLLYGQWRSSRRTKFVFDNLFSIFLFQVLQMIVIAELDFFFYAALGHNHYLNLSLLYAPSSMIFVLCILVRVKYVEWDIF